MFNKLLTVPKAYLALTTVRMFLAFALFSGLGLLTLFMAAIMYIDWQWKIWCIFATCLGPWLLVIIILAIMTAVCDARFNKLQREALSFRQSGIVSKLVSWGFAYFLSRRRR